ncbi:MAG: hypothetical protein GXP19_05980 [Gammaproteobacteria bacterium]|nr:hypothetical protein [Gammaproteobacteria bacterium]
MVDFTSIVGSDEPITRFVVEKSYFRKGDLTPKPKAFYPDRYATLSVSRVIELDDNRIWDIGYEFAEVRGKPLLGRIDIIAEHFYDNNLDFDPDNNPPRHANVVDWPDEKQEWMSAAQDLAANAEFFESS